MKKLNNEFGVFATHRDYFRKIKHPGIGRFVKSALFEKSFLILIKGVKSNFQLGE